jgi:hypothetical protein
VVQMSGSLTGPAFLWRICRRAEIPGLAQYPFIFFSFCLSCDAAQRLWGEETWPTPKNRF